MTLLDTDCLKLRRGAHLGHGEFRELAALVLSFLGIHIPQRRRYLLENRLCSRLEALSLNTFSEYIEFLRYDPGGSRELDRLVERVTTNETSFFRDYRQLNVFREKLLQPMAARRFKEDNRFLSIWSAGCSSGEEPYTLAMIIAEQFGASLPQWEVVITATDVSSRVLRQATRGVYGKSALRSTPQAIRDKYFIEDGPRFEVVPSIRNMVRFMRVNLNDAKEMRTVPKSDFIFCRNVIIYFEETVKHRLASAFQENLVPEGSLLLGHSETLHGVSQALVPVPDMGTPVYRKATNGAGAFGTQGRGG